ncbi:MAG: DUF6174 domain-containing protein [Chloroflexota bacterium]|nr:DUF6174 domain-containing protein [Chloroflexota bacterium]
MRRIIAPSILILSLVAACDSSPAPTPTLVPVPTVTQSPSPPAPTVAVSPTIPPRINITRADYTAALAKWQRQGITDYEISVYQLSLGVNGVSRLRVQGDQATVLANPYQYPDDELARIYTVAGLFAEVDAALREVEQDGAYGRSFPMVYNVTFDSVLGYPRHFDQGCYEPMTDSPSVCPSDTFVTRKVQSLTVLAAGTATPSVPATTTISPTISPPRSNITRADYNAALAKWQRQGISDYEISVYELSSNLTNGGVYRLRVQGDRITVLSDPYLFRDTTAATPTPYPGDASVRYYTVAGLFGQIDKDLTTVEQGKVAELGVVPYVYHVTFDPVRGYPSASDTKCDEQATGGPSVCPSDTGVTQSVNSLTALTPPQMATPTIGP